jgi:adenylate cyclase
MLPRYYAYVIAYIVAAIIILPWTIIQPRALNDLRNIAFDTYQRLNPRRFNTETPIRIIGIDEDSLKVFGQWPWPRHRLAELTQKLRQYGASAIVFDFIFAEPARENLAQILPSFPNIKIRHDLERIISAFPDADKLLAAEFAQAPTVLGIALSKDGENNFIQKSGIVTVGDDPEQFLFKFPAFIGPIRELFGPVKGLGFTNWIPDHDQVVRNVPLIMSVNGSLITSLALEALRVAQNTQNYVIRSSNASNQTAFGQKTGINAIKVGNLEIQTGPSSEVRPHYSYSDERRYLSAKDVLENKINRDIIQGKIIIIGAKATGLGDTRATPLEPVIPGVEVHAQLLEALISSELLYRPDWSRGLEIGISIIAFLITMTLIFFGPSLLSATFGPLIILIFVFGSYYLFKYYQLLIDPVYPSLIVIGGYLFGTVTVWRTEALARSQVRQAFGKFVSPSVVEKIAENPRLLVLGGETKDLTILFCDLRNFTNISETMSAVELSQFMNSYLTPMTDAILVNEGTVDKYMGDAILAFWNAPIDVHEHAKKAVNSALNMRRELNILNNSYKTKQNLLEFGIGLHYGPCSVGNMGSSQRFDYSVLGDTVNFASRLDRASVFFCTDILASKSVKDLSPDNIWLEIGPVQVVGKSECLEIFALVEGNHKDMDDFQEKWTHLHSKMMNYYKARRFIDASAIAQDLKEYCNSDWINFYTHFEKSFLELSNEALPQDWEPVWRLKNK